MGTEGQADMFSFNPTNGQWKLMAGTRGDTDVAYSVGMTPLQPHNSFLPSSYSSIFRHKYYMRCLHPRIPRLHRVKLGRWH